MVLAFFTGGQRLNGNVVVVAAQEVSGTVHHYCNRHILFQDGILPDGIDLVIEFQVVANVVSVSMKPLVLLDMIVAQRSAADEQEWQCHGG